MVESSRLSNGMLVLTENIPHAISVSVGLWILKGARNEPSEWNGISHFVEHLFFKGTEQRTTLDISREIETVGGSLNAFTGKEFMCLHARVLDSHLALAIDLLSDIFLDAVFPEEEIKREREVILQEIRMVEDSPEELIHELSSSAYWRDHPLGRSTLGTEEIVGRLDRPSLTSFADRLRDPKKVILTIAGKMNHKEAMELAEAHFTFPDIETLDMTQEKPKPHRGVHVHLKELEQAHLCLDTLGYPYSHPKRFAFHVLNTMLGGGMSSRLFQEIREQRGLAYSVYSFQAAYFDAGRLGVYVGTSPKAVPEVIERVLKNLTRLKEELISETELTTAKEQLKGNLLLSTESTSSRMSKLAMNEIYFGKQLDTMEVIQEIDRVEAQHVLDITADLFLPEYLSLTILGDVDRNSLLQMSLSV